MKIINSFHGEFAFLSNFYPSPFEEGLGNIFPTVEHWLQSMKAVDTDERWAIRNAGSPIEAKRLGRRCQLRDDWEAIKNNIMLVGLRLKFQQNKDLLKKLIDTGDSLLIEGNGWHDNYWGDCWCEKCEETLGQNKLGKLLMEVREELKSL